MIEVGESTGALPSMLASVAEFYEDDVNTRMTAALSLIEPMIMIFMGVFVAFVLVALVSADLFALGHFGIRRRHGDDRTVETRGSSAGDLAGAGARAAVPLRLRRSQGRRTSTTSCSAPYRWT